MRRSRFSLVAGVVLVLAVGLAVNTITEHTRPSGSLATTFALGEDARVGDFQVHVHGAQAAAVLDDDGAAVETNGVWVILDLSMASTKLPNRLYGLGLRDSAGRTFTVSSRSPASLWQVAPDTWIRGEVAFEVPADALGDLTVFVWPYLRSNIESDPVGYGVTQVTVTEVENQRVSLAEPTLLPAGER
ncbi:hypothetical protein [Ruania alba]|uniref:DUF4352 domain-containing protein n=1 Tax=Ruania alba TaxID=648782 RepID=A0A1H5MLM0_9MICO|nr:hypothetical protein [Ruania alba]SEE89627.1 hypothetical protein SAMN04488554_3449 [Ruania alba]